MTNRSIPPHIQPIEAFPLPKPRRERLPNGIPLFYFDNPNLDLIHILVQVHTGSLYQPEKHVAQFTYSLLRESSPRFSAEETAEKLDFYGTNMTTNVGLEWVQFLISVPKNNMADILPVILDFLVAPNVRPENLRIMQDKELKNLAYNAQKTDYQALQLMWNELLRQTFPAVSQNASPETINALTVSQLQDFHQKTFCAENTAVYVSGNTGSKEESLIAALLSAIPHGKPAAALPLIPQPTKAGDLLYKPVSGCLQSSLLLCFVSTGYNAAERTPFSVLNTLTGGYFSSRLMKSLREQHGLTYGIFSSSTFFGEQSVFSINGDVNAGQTARAMDLCFEELQRLQREPVEVRELDMVKNYMAGIQLRAADTTVNAMQKYAYFNRFGLDETELHRYMTSIRKVSAEDIQKLAQEHFSYNKFTRIVVGSYLADK